MKKLLCMLLVGYCLVSKVNGQSLGRNYKTALGVKVWDGGGISFKTFVAPNNALEVIGYFYKEGTRLTGLYEIHGPVSGAPGLKWYIGPGAHIGFYNYKGYQGDKMIAGIDGVLGLDYKINKAPINLSIDWQPSFEFADGRGFVSAVGVDLEYDIRSEVKENVFKIAVK